MVRILTKTQLQSLLGDRNNVPEVDGIPDRICVARKRAPIESGQWQAAVESGMRNACGGVDWRAVVREYPRLAFPVGELEFPVSGLGSVSLAGGAAGSPQRRKRIRTWRGLLRLPEQATIPVWIRLELEILTEVAIATRELAAGTEIGNDDFRIERIWHTETSPGNPCEGVAFEKPPVGAVLRTGVAAGEPLPTSGFRRAPAVRRGSEVELEVVSGATFLRAQGRAEGNGDLGQRVRVTNRWNGRGQTGTVTGQGKVRLE